MKDRLISVHLHDNNGRSDEHKLPFTGTIDWEKVVAILSASAYTKCISLESSMRNAGIADEGTFLAKAFDAGSRLSSMLTAARRAG